jgi:hypothetical protein
MAWTARPGLLPGAGAGVARFRGRGARGDAVAGFPVGDDARDLAA